MGIIFLNKLVDGNKMPHYLRSIRRAEMDLISGEQCTYKQIVEGLKECGGTSRIYLWQLREANGNDRLGVNVLNEISGTLKKKRIGMCQKLKDQTQWDTVRIYDKDSPIGGVIDGLSDLTGRSDDLILDFAQAGHKIRQIEEILS